MTKPIQIRGADLIGDIRALAELIGTSTTGAVAHAVRRQLAVERANANASLTEKRAKVERNLRSIWNLPVTGPRLRDEDLYDEHGLPH